MRLHPHEDLEHEQRFVLKCSFQTSVHVVHGCHSQFCMPFGLSVPWWGLSSQSDFIQCILGVDSHVVIGAPPWLRILQRNVSF